MSEEQHQKYIEEVKVAVADSIEKHVNGKIRGLDEKVTTYIKEDTEWKATADPYIKLAVNIAGTWKFVIYLVGGVVAILGLIIGIEKLK